MKLKSSLKRTNNKTSKRKRVHFAKKVSVKKVKPTRKIMKKSKKNSFSKKSVKTSRIKKTLKNKKSHNKSLKKTKKYMKGGMTNIKNIQHTQLPNGGHNPITFYPKNFLNSIPHYSMSSDMHGINDTLQSSTNIPIQTAGGIIPNDIVNLGRNVIYGAQSLYSNAVGDTLTSSADPNVLSQPAMKTEPVLDIEPINIDEIYTQVDSNVAGATQL